MGLTWSPDVLGATVEMGPILSRAGLYRVIDRKGVIIYIGQSQSLGQRWISHTRGQRFRSWPEHSVSFSPRSPTGGRAQHLLLEEESDLLGFYYLSSGGAPAAQYGQR